MNGFHKHILVDTGYPPESVGYPPESVGYPPESVDYPPESVDYPPDPVAVVEPRYSLRSPMTL